MPQETEQRRLSAVKSMQNIIDSIIYAMYTRENVEYCWACKAFQLRTNGIAKIKNLYNKDIKSAM
jgi:hypothetical protein